MKSDDMNSFKTHAARIAAATPSISYSTLKFKMRAVIRLAEDVIKEIETGTPDNVLLSDMAIEEMEILTREIESVFDSSGPMVNYSNGNRCM